MRTILPVLSALAFLTACPSAFAQCESCASGDMLFGTMQTQIDTSTNQRMIDDTKQHDRDIYLRKNESTGGGARSNDIMQRVENTSLAVLTSEFSRRVAISGKGAAQRWLNDASRNVGGEMGRLRSEYERRVRGEGRARADNWYVRQAQAVSQRYVAESQQ